MCVNVFSKMNPISLKLVFMSIPVKAWILNHTSHCQFKTKCDYFFFFETSLFSTNYVNFNKSASWKTIRTFDRISCVYNKVVKSFQVQLEKLEALTETKKTPKTQISILFVPFIQWLWMHVARKHFLCSLTVFLSLFLC